MKTIGKITQPPDEIREQLNQKMQAGDKPASLLKWLNALPEVQALIAEKFDDHPITKQNLSEYKRHSFRNWQMREEALHFIKNAQADDSALQKAIGGQLSGILSRWTATRYVSVAQAVSNGASDPDTELRRLSLMSSHVTALRRGDLVAERIKIEQQRLEMERARKQEELEALFWEWTKRPDINAKLYPHRDPEKVRREVDRIISHRLLGIPRKHEEEPPDNPACYI